jgi:hypothetical protein
MRWFFRLLFLLALVVGVLLAFAYPRIMTDVAGPTTLRERVYAPETGFELASFTPPNDAQTVSLALEMTIDGRFQPAINREILHVVVTAGDTAVLDKAVDFTRAQLKIESPQAVAAIYRAEVGSVAASSAVNYLVTVSPSNIEGLTIRAIDLDIITPSAGVDDRALPMGFILIVVGFMGLVTTFRRKRENNPNSQPPPTRWGRG